VNTQYGFFEGVDEHTYAQIPAYRFSQLKHFAKSPLSYRYWTTHQVEQTDAMRLGNVIHSEILEPGSRRIAVWPGPGIRRGGAYDAWCEENSGCTLLNRKEADQVAETVAGIRTHKVAEQYLRHGKSEVTMVFHDPALGCDFKARIDKMTANRKHEAVLISLKSTTCCAEFEFSAQFARLHYAAQDALYQNGYHYLRGDLPKMVTIAAEKNAPYECAVYVIPNDVLRVGQQLIAEWVERLNECEKKDRWPAAMEEEQELALPSWAVPGGDFSFDDLEPIAR
jgi:hypothetical protein